MNNEDTLIRFCLAIKTHEGFYPGSTSWSRNNPGNLRWSKFQAGQRGGFSYFLTYDAGWQALLDDVRNKCLGHTRTGLTPNSTIADFFKIYSPASDNNDPVSYARIVAEKCQLYPSSKLKEVYSAPEATQRILCVLLNYAPTRLWEVKAGMESVKSWFIQNGISTTIEYVFDTKAFPIVQVSSAGKLFNVYDPKQVRDYVAPHITDQHFVMVSYRQTVPAATPTEFSEVMKGALIGQLPVLDISNEQWIQSFTIHELLHGWYYRANQSGLQVTDDVHAHSYEDTRPEINYSDIVRRLSTYKDIIFKALPDRPLTVDEQKISIIQVLLNMMRQLLGLLKGRGQ